MISRCKQGPDGIQFTIYCSVWKRHHSFLLLTLHRIGEYWTETKPCRHRILVSVFSKIMLSKNMMIMGSCSVNGELVKPQLGKKLGSHKIYKNPARLVSLIIRFNVIKHLIILHVLLLHSRDSIIVPIDGANSDFAEFNCTCVYARKYISIALVDQFN